MPDRTLGWYTFAVRAGTRSFEQVGFDAIYSISGPPTCHLIARRLQRVSQVPWIADYRDLWSLNHHVTRRPVFQWAEEKLESWAVKNAAHLVTVTEPWRAQLADLTGRPVATIPHGFDQQDFDALPPYRPGPDEPLTLLYPGTLYPGYQDPTPLFEAIALLDGLSSIQPGELLVRFVGTDPAYPAALAGDYGVSEYVEFTPFVSFRRSLAMQSQASALLLFKWGDDREIGHCPAKLYDYLGVKRPILVLGEKHDVVDDIVGDCEAGVSVSSVGGIVEVLRGWLRDYQEHGALPWRVNERRRQVYTRRKAAEALASLLDEVVAETNS
jgi:glycosyltransferase involved in cell wall biosynthesis